MTSSLRAIRRKKMSDEPQPDGRQVTRWIPVLAAALLMAWAALVLMLGAVSRSDSSCSGCHAMREYARAHSGSAHGSIGCDECHSRTGGLGLAADGLAMQRRISGQILGHSPSKLAYVSDLPCRGCHGTALAGTLRTSNGAVRHVDFADVPCFECHGGVAHKLERRVYGAAQMEDCTSCHNQDPRDVSGCALCHTGEEERRIGVASVWRTTHGANWSTTHGMGDTRTCRACHSHDYCDRCHGTAIPHADDWKARHGATVSTQGATACRTCHQEAWCVRCHGTRMPHPVGFKRVHGKEADRLGDSSCLRCHPEEACAECHLRSSHPNLPGVGMGHGERAQ